MRAARPARVYSSGQGVQPIWARGVWPNPVLARGKHSRFKVKGDLAGFECPIHGGLLTKERLCTRSLEWRMSGAQSLTGDAKARDAVEGSSNREGYLVPGG